jgi:hypothetical protein
MNTLHSILCGKLLGDATLSIETNTRARLKIKQKMADSTYIFEILGELMDYPVLIPFGPNNPYALFPKKDPRTNKVYPAFEGVSLSSDFLTGLYHIWYPQGNIKIVPREYVHQYLDARALAILYQDDGCLVNHSRINIATDSFPLEDIEFIFTLLYERFHIKAHIDKDKRIDISSKRYVEIFLSHIQPYLSDSMDRKLPKEYYKKLRAEVSLLLMEKYSEEKEYIRRRYLISPNTYNRIKGIGSAKLNSALTRLLMKELMKVHNTKHRVVRILETIEQGEEPQVEIRASAEDRREIKVDISDFVDRGLDILRSWTGITRNEYVDLLLRGEIPEVDMFSVKELAEITGTKGTTIHNYLGKFKEFFPYEKVSRQHFYLKTAIEVIQELKKHKNQRENKIRPILVSKFAHILELSQDNLLAQNEELSS